MDDEDYREILAFTRALLEKNNLGAIDQQIFSDRKQYDGSFSELRRYLDLLRGEVSLGSDKTLSSILRRFRSHVRTESGDEIAGIRMTMTGGDRERLRLDYLDFEPDADFTALAVELKEIIALLDEDYRKEDKGSPEDE